MRSLLLLPFVCVVSLSGAQSKQAATIQALSDKGLSELGAYAMLHELTTKVGGRPGGSPAAAKAVDWGRATMESLGFKNVRLVPCMVPHWVRGDVMSLSVLGEGGETTELSACALGRSPGTPEEGITAQIVEVTSFEEAEKLGDLVKGKILFFNQPMDPTLLNTFAAYGKAGFQRFSGPAEAAKLGAVAALTRSLTLAHDDVPHTGVTGYPQDGPKVPGAAVSVIAAEKLHDLLQQGPVTVNLKMNCRMMPDEPSANVIGEIPGSTFPDEIIVMGGHLDSWDTGTGAHDDGAGVTQGLEALRLLNELGMKPKRTIRVVLWMDEEVGGTGAEAYLQFAKASGQKHLAGIESDAGGFAPRTFGVSLSPRKAKAINRWVPLLNKFEIERFEPGGEGGADVGPLAALHTVLFGLSPESQRYFDYHHSPNDKLSNVNPRELELGALAMASLAWLISEEGLPKP